MHVARAETCDLTGERATSPIDARKGRLLITALHDASGRLDGALAFQLTIAFAEDGSARASGVIHLPDADPPALLVATGEALVDCTDGDITGLMVPVKSPSGGDGVVFFAVTGSSLRIPGSRLYVGNLTFTGGDTTFVLTGVQIVVKVIEPARATTPDEREENTTAGVGQSAAKHKAKGKQSNERQAKGGTAGKGKHGKRRS
jgi:hypothetical protein